MGLIRDYRLGAAFAALILVLALTVLLLVACGRGKSPATLTAQVSPVAEQLAELEELTAPPGVDAGVFQELKDALANALRARGAVKLVATPPPQTPQNAPTLTATPSSGVYFTLRWKYRNSGDYNQEGTVNIMDITPLAAHFQESVADYPEIEPIDGSGDGAITILDVTPLAAGFFNDCAGYLVKAATSPTATFDTLDTVVLADALEGPGRLSFEYQVDAATNHAFKVVAIDGPGAEGAESNVVQASAVAPDITAVSPDSGNVGDEILFEATVTGSQPMNFHWSFGGGVTEDPPDSSAPYATVTLGSAGEYDGSVTATNAIGEDAFDFHYEVIYVGEAPDITNVSPTGGSPNQERTFTATVTGDVPITYDWNFGGGATPNTPQTDVPEVMVTLSGTAGDYSASLTATNGAGSDNYPFMLHISSVNHPPTVTVTVNLGDLSEITAEADDLDGDALSFAFGSSVPPDMFLEFAPYSIPPTTEYTQVCRLYHWYLGDAEPWHGVPSCTVNDGQASGADDAAIQAYAYNCTGEDASINLMTVGDSVKVGEELRAIVYFYTSAFDVREFPAIRVEFEDKLDVDPADSYNVGTWGPEGLDPDFADGLFWMSFDTAGSKILPTPSEYSTFGPFDADYWIGGVQVPPGRKYIEARALPDGGTYAQTAGGHGFIFNFEFIAVAAGTAHVRFISQYSETEGGEVLDGTYYTSTTGGEHHLFDVLTELDVEVTG